MKIEQWNYVQMAEIEIDLGAVRAVQSCAVTETAVRVEPGVLVLYAISEKDSPAREKVFEIYRAMEAYRSYLETAHFGKYKATTEKIVRSLKLVQKCLA